jgi:hypothetical protein
MGYLSSGRMTAVMVLALVAVIGDLCLVVDAVVEGRRERWLPRRGTDLLVSSLPLLVLAGATAAGLALLASLDLEFARDTVFEWEAVTPAPDLLWVTALLYLVATFGAWALYLWRRASARFDVAALGEIVVGLVLFAAVLAGYGHLPAGGV